MNTWFSVAWTGPAKTRLLAYHVQKTCNVNISCVTSCFHICLQKKIFKTGNIESWEIYEGNFNLRISELRGTATAHNSFLSFFLCLLLSFLLCLSIFFLFFLFFILFAFFFFFFFFKQKTAYEILTCDWSSDVCSSDLKVLLAYCTKLVYVLNVQHFVSHIHSPRHVVYCGPGWAKYLVAYF